MRMTRGVVVRYVSAGGRGLPSQAGWPFARVEVSGGEARTRLFRTGVAIPSSTPVEVREPTSQFGKRAMRTELRFQLASPQAGVAIVEILFHDRTRAQEALAALREAGFEIDTAGAGPQP
jgi:hypothetical protein